MPKMEWYGDRDDTHRLIVRGVPGIKAANVAEANEIAAKARAIMAPHHANNADEREPGDSISEITVTTGSVDAFVNLEDADGGARAIETFLAPLKRAAYG